MATVLVHFTHGRESDPGSRKIAALAGVAHAGGWKVACLDYSHTTDPALRLAQLLDACENTCHPLLLVGSSMGGWVAAEAAARLGAQGLFLLAPALYMPGYPTEAPPVPAGSTEIVHGWDDAVIPYANAVRFARKHRCTLHLVRDDHRLNACIPLLRDLFGAFLARLERAG
jgi:pimeloyl-ACP methyl ester carboxylesterase